MCGGIIDHDPQPAVRIGPFQFFDRAVERHDFRVVEHRKGMMRKGGCGERQGGAED
jgi:hypothetical protein